MVITFAAILFGLIALIQPLQRNRFVLLNSVAIVGIAYFIETHYFKAPMFNYKTILLLVVFQVITINITTFIAYWIDKRAAQRGAWRVPEKNLHLLEFLGGWAGALVAQKIFRHKSKKIAYLRMFKVMIVMEFAAVYVILKFLNII